MAVPPKSNVLLDQCFFSLMASVVEVLLVEKTAGFPRKIFSDLCSISKNARCDSASLANAQASLAQSW